ncbi:uncharacterized protein LOC122373444, partial [Amphibalanus amphitrite]|uniref:uncharacterized protein LOC122373444 n=1 Tax=Amphibalanus amphitrite TaxID=1232801 RepID=UPI001C909752
MKLTILLAAAVLVTASAAPIAELNLNYLPPTKPFQPPDLSYLPPLESSYLPPSQRSKNVEENLVDTGAHEEGDDASSEEEVTEESGSEDPVEEEEAPVEAEEVEEAAVEGSGSEEEPAGDDAPVSEFIPFPVEEAGTEEDSADGSSVEDGTVKVDQAHSVDGSYHVREDGEGYRTTDA